MKLENVYEDNKILEYMVGSHVYGTNTETSDTDFAGIFVAPKRFYLGLDKVETLNLSISVSLTNFPKLRIRLLTVFPRLVTVKNCTPNTVTIPNLVLIWFV